MKQDDRLRPGRHSDSGHGRTLDHDFVGGYIGQGGQRGVAGTRIINRNPKPETRAPSARSPGHVFSRGQLLNAAGDGLLHVSDRAIDSHIKNLRKKIAMIRPEENLLASVYGVGYRLDLT